MSQILNPFGDGKGPGTADFERAKAKCKELNPEAYPVYSGLRPASERCRIQVDETFDVGGVSHHATALVASGRTWPEALEMYFNYMADNPETRKAVFFDKVLRGGAKS